MGFEGTEGHSGVFNTWDKQDYIVPQENVTFLEWYQANQKNLFVLKRAGTLLPAGCKFVKHAWILLKKNQTKNPKQNQTRAEKKKSQTWLAVNVREQVGCFAWVRGFVYADVFQ